MIGPNRILVDKEKIDIDGREAYRLYFYDEQEGYIIKVISFVALSDLKLNEPTVRPLDETVVNQNLEGFKNAIQQEQGTTELRKETQQ